jgi:hypothetical protein
MRPRLEACYFGSGKQGDIYARMAHVLDYTARLHCQGWDVNVQRLEPPDYVSAMGNASHVWNTQKLEFWWRRTLEAPDGAQVLLIDGDMMIRKPLDDVWSRDFEMAYTFRDGGTRLPLNGGVVFVRVSEATRAFMTLWWETNLRFLRRPLEHRNWRLKYAGINQASFGCLLEHGTGLARVEKLPCSEWNLCEWERHDPERARIVHIKSGLRRALFNVFPAPAGGTNVRRLMALWLQTEKEMREWQKRRAVTSASSAIEPTPSTSAAV